MLRSIRCIAFLHSFVTVNLETFASLTSSETSELEFFNNAFSTKLCTINWRHCTWISSSASNKKKHSCIIGHFNYKL